MVKGNQYSSIIIKIGENDSYYGSDEHAGCGSFAYEENIMNWIFTKSK